MTYVSPYSIMGMRNFSKCEELGISAIIIPDIPYEEGRGGGSPLKPMAWR